MYYYSLKIQTSSDSQIEEITKIIGLKSNRPELGWEIEISRHQDDLPIPFINNFLGILSGKYNDLERIGINRENISIWILYEYEEQCNMEFCPSDLQKIGNEGITLCISCWEK